MNFNKDNFTLAELQTNLPPDVFLRDEYISTTKKITYWEIPTIQTRIETGSENLYFEIAIYPKEGYQEFNFTIYSKDNHSGLMKWITELLSKLI